MKKTSNNGENGAKLEIFVYSQLVFLFLFQGSNRGFSKCQSNSDCQRAWNMVQVCKKQYFPNEEYVQEISIQPIIMDQWKVGSYETCKYIIRNSWERLWKRLEYTIISWISDCLESLHQAILTSKTTRTTSFQHHGK